MTLLSKTFHGQGVGTGLDQIPILEEMWDGPIEIVGVELALTEGAKYVQYAFAGNGYSPDVMLMLGAGEVSGRVFYPTGLSFPFAGSHVDCHICVKPKKQFQVFLTIYYVRERTN